MCQNPFFFFSFLLILLINALKFRTTYFMLFFSFLLMHWSLSKNTSWDVSKSLFLQHATVEVYYSMFFITNFIIFLIQVFHLLLGSLISVSSLSHSLLLLLLSLVHTPTDIIANFGFFFFFGGFDRWWLGWYWVVGLRILPCFPQL